MATSIAFGELFATVIVLYLVPVTYSLYWSAGGRFTAAESGDADTKLQLLDDGPGVSEGLSPATS